MNSSVKPFSFAAVDDRSNDFAKAILSSVLFGANCYYHQGMSPGDVLRLATCSKLCNEIINNPAFEAFWKRNSEAIFFSDETMDQSSNMVNWKSTFVYFCRKEEEIFRSFKQPKSLGCIPSKIEITPKKIDMEKPEEVFKIMKQIADQNDLQAKYDLAIRYEKGKDVIKDLTLAFSWLKHAADEGHKEAQYAVARFFIRGIGVEKNVQKAFYYAQLSAKQGSAEAQYSLSTFYKEGISVEKDLTKAFKWLKRSADQGLPVAKYKLANDIIQEIGPEIGLDKAHTLGLLAKNLESEKIKRAAILEHAKDLHDMAVGFYNGTIGEKDFAQAFFLMKEAADEGYAPAQLKVSDFYRKGFGTEPNLKESLKYLKLAVNQGLATAQYNLAVSYSKGTYGEKNQFQAFKYLKLSADQGFDEAQYNLSLYYFNGEGTKQDFDESLKYLHLAANQGHTRALERIAKANNSEDQEHANSLYNMACGFLDGTFGKIDFLQGETFMRLAAEAGHIEAKRHLNY